MKSTAHEVSGSKGEEEGGENNIISEIWRGGREELLITYSPHFFSKNEKVSEK
jgi:hypothetical protein